MAEHGEAAPENAGAAGAEPQSRAGSVAGPVLGQGWLLRRGPNAEFPWRRQWTVLREAVGHSVLACYADERCQARKTDMEILKQTRVYSVRAKGAPGDAAKHLDRPFSFVIDLDPAQGAERRLVYFDAVEEASFKYWLGLLGSAADHSTNDRRVSAWLGSRSAKSGRACEGGAAVAVPSANAAKRMWTMARARILLQRETRRLRWLHLTRSQAPGMEEQMKKLRMLSWTCGRVCADLRKLENLIKTVGENHESTLLCARELAGALHQWGQRSAAADLYRTVLLGRRRLFGDCHPAVWECCYCLGVVLLETTVSGLAAKHTASGIVLSDGESDSSESEEDDEGFHHDLTKVSSRVENLNVEEAEHLLLEALEGYRTYVGRDHPEALRVARSLAAAEERLGRPEVAQRLLREVDEAEDADAIAAAALMAQAAEAADAIDVE
eukprot:TRINITY_DN8983_c0_g1_i1.p1 TRINITY_DN8983_c0_g1~~TRINITY_DN8983_c0_g1_i1.p1  ORF type:complete len:439 (+),score=76.96 TRINITY_DN8983_c0_g1_i1:104-1420(+)